MTLQSTVSAIRFGYGLRPEGPRETRASLLAGLATGNAIAQKYPVTSGRRVLVQARAFRTAIRAAEKNGIRQGDRDIPARRDLRLSAALGIKHGTARILDSKSAFFERLSWFWADHFTAVGKNLPARAMAPAYLDEAIRPHVTGRFSDMLKAVVSHPFMLVYLDQIASVGPNSVVGKRRNKGLNENLARELLELHTLGVGSDYVQQDVRQLAELLTGLGFAPGDGFAFNPRMSEPGVKTLLGNQYGGRENSLADIYRALDDLARHPDTARHLSRKLAVHFVSDTPEVSMVEQMTAAYRRTDGDLMAVYSAMLDHPSAWTPPNNKARQPFDFIMSALVALNVSGKELLALKLSDQRALVTRPLEAMGQPFMQARGPDGWPEAAESWITPQGLAGRIAWSVGVSEFIGDRVGDPQIFLQQALADAADAKLTAAVAQTTSVHDGVALVLASAEFNRR